MWKAANDDDSEQGFQLRPSRQIGCQEKGAAYSLFSEGHGSSPLEGIVGLGLDEREDHNQPPVKKGSRIMKTVNSRGCYFFAALFLGLVGSVAQAGPIRGKSLF